MKHIPARQVHLDFHTSGLIGGVGKDFKKEQFQNCLKKGHVNSITVFAKCHHGYAYFPSETNQMHPGLHFDLLSAQLEACKEIGVAAPVYISVGFDEKYAVEHPDHLHVWHRGDTQPKVLTTNGVKHFENAGYHLLCLNSPYLETVRAQTEEVTRRFMPVGLFFDIVAPRPCYCKYCNAAIKALGWDDSDESHRKYGELLYKKYVETVNGAALAVKPDIRLFHNAGHIPAGRHDLLCADTHLELESLPTGGWGYDHFPKSAKYVARLGKDYLGMTGKFHLSWGEFGGFKHPNALRYEAALSLACGARCSVGDQMHPYGFLDDATYELIGKAYKEVEEVEEYAYDVTPVADIGVLSLEAYKANGERNLPEDTGASRILLEGHYLFDVLDLDSDFSPYKLLILPDAIVLKGKLLEKLRSFVAHGGKLLCSGVSGTDETGKFAFDFGVDFRGLDDSKPSYYHPCYNALGLTPSSYVFYADLYDTALTDQNATVLGYSRKSLFNRTPEHFCSHQHTPFETEDNAPGVILGKEGGYIAWNIFSEYATVGSIILKDTVIRVIDALLGDGKTVVTNLGAQGVVTLMRQNDKHRDVLHVLYAIPTKRGSGVEIIEDLPAVCDTAFAVKTDKAVKRVRLVPEDREIPFETKDGAVCFTIDRFSCKQVVSLEYDA